MSSSHLVLTAEPGAEFFSSGHDLGDVFVRRGKTSPGR
jgi:hypothetical protein